MRCTEETEQKNGLIENIQQDFIKSHRLRTDQQNYCQSDLILGPMRAYKDKLDTNLPTESCLVLQHAMVTGR